MGTSTPVKVLGKYRLAELLGEGGMSSVYRGVAEAGSAAGRELAVKVLDLTGPLPDNARERFMREIFTLSTLSHPHIVPVLDYGEAEGSLYYAMPLLGSGTLETRLAGGARLPLGELGRLCEDLLEALRYLHARGFLHRDIKPANIMFDAGGKAVLMDFGLVKPEKGSNLTRTGRVIGTPRYIPPEILKSGDVDETSDLYQVGVVAYQAATGALPYDDEALLGILEESPAAVRAATPSKLNAELSEPLSNFLLNGVEWERSRRYPNAPAMLEDLGCALRGSPVARRKPAGVVSRAVEALKPGAIGGRYEKSGVGRPAPGVDYLECTDGRGARVLLRPMPLAACPEAEMLQLLAACAGVQHRVVVPIRDLVFEGRQPFLVYEKPAEFRFLEPPSGHGLGPRIETLRRMLELASGLGALHARGLVHGDVSIQNVMIGAQTEVRLLGLGVHAVRASGLLEKRPGDSTARINTWMAPEQSEGQPATAATDVYSAGRLLSLLVHGRLLPASPAAQPDAGSDAMGRLLARATAWSPGDRYADARELARALELVLPRRSGSARRAARPRALPEKATGQAVSASRRHWFPAVLVAAIALAILVALIVR